MKISTFFRNDFWRILPDEKKPIKTFFIKILRVLFSSVSAFYRDECSLKASLLTFYSLISIVPFLALAIGIAQGFGFENFLKTQILSSFKDQKDVISLAINFAYALITNLKGQFIVGFGLFFIFFSIFALLESIEKQLNHIWKVEKRRSLSTRAINYVALLIICPIVFTASSSLTIFISSFLEGTTSEYFIIKEISSYAISLFKFLPFLLSWITFSFIYLFTPNTKIHFFPRIFAGVLAGTLFQFWQIGYIEFQLTITSYNTVYGSFAALPLFLVWLQVNFLIFLYGAEIAAHIENDKFYSKLKSTDEFSEATPKHLALLILYQSMKLYQTGGIPISTTKFSENNGIPLFIARDIMHILEKEKLIAEVDLKNRSEEHYMLITNPDLIKIKRIQDIMEKSRGYSILVKHSSGLDLIFSCFKEFDTLIEESAANLTLSDLREKG